MENSVEDFVTDLNNKVIPDEELYYHIGQLSMEAHNKLSQMLYVCGIESGLLCKDEEDEI